jgi:hypothetical protein
MVSKKIPALLGGGYTKEPTQEYTQQKQKKQKVAALLRKDAFVNKKTSS